jgi:L-alanine-DL-glutamate epimerase-like enolase superfamily enzyme
MKLKLIDYSLRLKHRFTIATNSRTTTPVLLLALEHDGIVGYGEASMPPYLGETPETARDFLSSLDLSLINPDDIGSTMEKVDKHAPGHTAAKAALDIALYDLLGKKKGKALHKLWNVDSSRMPATSYTVGIGTPEEVRQLVRGARSFPILKVKLGGADDRATIQLIREMSNKPIRVDVNQGWHDPAESLRMIDWLADQGVELVEQPLPADRINDLVWLRRRSPIPIIADEGVRRLADLAAAGDVYDGVNIKLMKSTGLHEARAMIDEARKLGLKIMIGCMTETSCAISAAACLAPLADWADLDGAELIDNDPFDGVKIIGGIPRLSNRPGIGVTPAAGIFE